MPEGHTIIPHSQNQIFKCYNVLTVEEKKNSVTEPSSSLMKAKWQETKAHL